jgi:hypothetical protein
VTSATHGSELRSVQALDVFAIILAGSENYLNYKRLSTPFSVEVIEREALYNKAVLSFS